MSARILALPVILLVSALLVAPVANGQGNCDLGCCDSHASCCDQSGCDAIGCDCGGCNSGCDAFSLFSSSGCGGSCQCRERLFGDLMGPKAPYAKWVVADLELTQFYQGVSSGGARRNDRYGGKLDYMFTFAGGLVQMHAETQFGQALVTDAGAFGLPNVNMLWPLPNEQETAITGLLVYLPITERLSAAGGKLNVLDFWTQVYPHVGRGVEGFMNLSSVSAGLPWLRFVNLSPNAAGLLRTTEDKQVQGGVLVFDLNNSSTTSGISDLFDDGAGVLGLWRFFYELGGNPGSHMFAGAYANRAYTSFDENPWLIVPGQGIVAPEKKGAWALTYALYQQLWADCCDPQRKVWLFNQWSLSDGDPSFARWGTVCSIEAIGVNKMRARDRMGIAYFYTQLSSDFRRVANALPTVDLESSVHGGEVYYNAELTPWFHVTGDLQVIDNENQSDDTAIVLGIRAHVQL